MTDITALGEILIDLTQTQPDEKGIPLFAANPGGVPANLAVAASRLGAKTAFIGKIGKDAFGDFLRKTLQENHVDTAGLSVDEKEHTTLAVVSLDSKGERSFCFYRDPGADGSLCWEDVPEESLKDTKILHFGSLSLVFDDPRHATMEAVRRAKENGAWISYDPNYRPSLWPDEETAVMRMKEPLSEVDILKVSDEELPLLTGTDDPAEGTAILQQYGIALIFVTQGADGAFYRFGEKIGQVPGVACKVADTNGSGDTFFGAALSRLVRFGSLQDLTEEELKEIVGFANRAASLTTSRHGAIPAMPTLDELTDRDRMI